MIDAKLLKDDLVAELKKLERDLRARIDELPDLRASLQAEWTAALAANRTAETFETWADQIITQAGVHWLLAGVFLRFIEDNQLIARPWLSGTPESGRLALARDRHEGYFREHPLKSDRDYLLAAFEECALLPGLGSFFDQNHNPLFRLPISGDAAMGLRSFWAQTESHSGRLSHDFTDPSWDTRFLGDLYQDLSEATRKRYALLQTPEFVEEFILDRTLTPAIAEFGYKEARLIDPTCGSGHFLLGAFNRLVAEWQRHAPSMNPRAIAQFALDNIAGVDLNPFAVAIARFRLMVAALRVAGTEHLSHAPNFKLNIAIGDSLLHGSRFGGTQTESMFQDRSDFVGTGLEHAYAIEDLADVRRILGRQYHAVVGNPPYIVVKDAALNAAYRSRYASCHRQYSLGCPFTERFFELAITGDAKGGSGAGYIGLITAKSFMKREFGLKLIEQVLPRLDLTHVIDTSCAAIPGHDTPTVILFGRHRPPFASHVRTVMGIKGNASDADNPSEGLVWSAIVRQTDEAGSESSYVSVVDTPRATFGRHPWSIGGGGAAELRELIEIDSPTLAGIGADVGYFVITGEDNCLMLPPAVSQRLGISHAVPIVEGDEVRDWYSQPSLVVLWPYDSLGNDILPDESAKHRDFLWPYKTTLRGRKAFGVPVEEKGLRWWDLREVYKQRFVTPLTITFAEITTHNRFVLERGGKLFKQTAPVIKLPANATEDDHLGLLGLLNSSVACFWLKQVCTDKGGDRVGGARARVRKSLWDERYAFNSTNVADFPLPTSRPLELARRLDALAAEITANLPATLLTENLSALPTREALDAARSRVAILRRQAVSLQEELDWTAYNLYGLLDERATDRVFLSGDIEPPHLALGERAFEIVLARRISSGIEQTSWFERHGSTPITEIPAHWPDAYRVVIQSRIDLIERDRNIGLIERPEYKRRWNAPEWNSMERDAVRAALLARLEDAALWPASDNHPPQITTTAKLADRLSHDAAVLHLASLYTGRPDADLGAIITELVTSESVPFLPVLRYTESGLRKHAQWESTWALQRQEDGRKEIGTAPIPPKYKKEDFKNGRFWDLRGGLDVPKERWISYPHCARGADPSLPIAWAGWNAQQQATALATYLLEMKDNEGWPRERLQVLLAGLQELVPWLKQWHNELDPTYGERIGNYYEGFVADQARELGYTLADLRNWQPAGAAARKGRRPRS